MRLVISILDNKVEVTLKNGRRSIDGSVFILENNLTEKLLPEIDKLFKRNNLEPGNIEKALFKTNIKSSFTTVRIGKAVVEAFNWAKNIK